MENPDVKTLEAKCHCGSVHFTIDVPRASLPVPFYLCQCSMCRFSTGAPCVFHTRLAKDVKPKYIAPSTEGNLTAYAFPQGSCTYDFCSTCGCHIAAVALDRSNWVVSTSIFTDHSPDNFRLTTCVYTKSAKDGGIAQFLSRVGGRELGEWNPPDDHPSAKLVESPAEVGEDGRERLRVQCHCGGVSFVVRRPTLGALDGKVPSKYLYADDKTKWLAVFDACDQCRLVNGTHVTGWVFLPLSVCEPHIGTDLRIGSSKTYSTSPGVLRSFCEVCGATIFYSHEKRNISEEGNIVDIAVGVIRAPEGYLAENWLGWGPHVAHSEAGRTYDREFAEALEEGVKKYVVERTGREPTRAIDWEA